jgi:hypothetical protein
VAISVIFIVATSVQTYAGSRLETSSSSHIPHTTTADPHRRPEPGRTIHKFRSP